tara:strand:- start:2119 stop:2472 length:354 start_codon:yes stop_codon:yes gene_type:complete
MEGRIVDASAQTIPRAVRFNPLGYTEEQLAQRDEKVHELSKKFTKVPPKWLEYLWDAMEKRTDEEITELIKNEDWLKPLKKDRQTGGVIKDACDIFIHNSEEFNNLTLKDREKESVN